VTPDGVWWFRPDLTLWYDCRNESYYTYDGSLSDYISVTPVRPPRGARCPPFHADPHPRTPFLQTRPKPDPPASPVPTLKPIPLPRIPPPPPPHPTPTTTTHPPHPAPTLPPSPLTWHVVTRAGGGHEGSDRRRERSA
jgi:hypothetical protein